MNGQQRRQCKKGAPSDPPRQGRARPRYLLVAAVGSDVQRGEEHGVLHVHVGAVLQQDVHSLQGNQQECPPRALCMAYMCSAGKSGLGNLTPPG